MRFILRCCSFIAITILAILLTCIYKKSYKTLKFGAKLLLANMGYRKIIVNDLRKFKHDASIVVFQHNSFFDGHILMSVFGGSLSLMIQSDYSEIPFMRVLFKNLGFIVKPVDKEKTGITGRVVEFVNENRGTAPRLLGIAPASWKAPLDNKIGEFSTGAFVPMKPVIPVLIRFGTTVGTWFTGRDNDEHKTLAAFLWERLTCSRIDAEVTLLEEIAPEPNMTPREFADKTCRAMKDYDATVPAFSLADK